MLLVVVRFSRGVDGIFSGEDAGDSSSDFVVNDCLVVFSHYVYTEFLMSRHQTRVYETVFWTDAPQCHPSSTHTVRFDAFRRKSITVYKSAIRALHVFDVDPASILPDLCVLSAKNF